MKGRVFNRGTQSKPNWWVSVELGYDESGKRKRHAERGGPNGTKGEAEEKLARIIVARGDGNFVTPSKLTVAEYLETWLASVKPSLRGSTYAGYSVLVTKHLQPGLGSRKLQKLTVADLDSWYASLIENGRRDSKGGLSRKSVANIHRVLRKALGDAVRKGLVPRNVADFAQVPKDRDAGHREMATWTADQLRSFLEETRANRLHPAFVLLAATGMRRGEILGLRWQDVDLDAARLSVRQTLLMVGNRVEWSTPKTKRSRRSIDLDKQTVAVLRSWKRKQAEERLLVGSNYEDSGLVFTKPDGSHLVPASFSQVFDRLVARSGLPKIRLHDLRHSHATIALAAGVHPKIVQERLGHSSVSLTLDVYSHSVPSMSADAAEKIASLFMAGGEA